MSLPSPLQPRDATRFLQRATFGPRSGDVETLISLGVDSWLDGQMAMTPSEAHLQRLLRTEVSTRRGYWRAVLIEPDQLRRRVAYALSQILVASSNGVGQQNLAHYIDLLEAHAFGTFRDLLEAVSTSQAMGEYLTFVNNRKADPRQGRVPDENYAREVMQLFTIGLWELEPDGTRRLLDGQPVPTYDQDDISGLARVFTGWRRPDVDTNARYSMPMVQRERDHELGSKSFLGVTIPENTPGEASLAIALDTLVAHPNVGPFIGRQLIQRLVTSNPSPAYVGRVAAVFDNNGTDVRGDLGAVVRAVLLDDEAWLADQPSTFGKLREPVLRFTVVARALDVNSDDDDDWGFDNTSDSATSLGQLPFASPSVFNFYRPGYVAPQTPLSDLDLVAPEFQIVDETSAIGWINWLGSYLRTPRGSQTYDLDALLAISDDVPALVTDVAARLCPDGISAALRAVVERNISDVIDDRNPDRQALERVLGVVLMIAASTDFLHER